MRIYVFGGLRHSLLKMLDRFVDPRLPVRLNAQIQFVTAW
jgi:hypothetical protein